MVPQQSEPGRTDVSLSKHNALLFCKQTSNDIVEMFILITLYNIFTNRCGTEMSLLHVKMETDSKLYECRNETGKKKKNYK